MLKDTTNNEELEQYLAERSYESVSLAETSADELTLRM